MLYDLIEVDLHRQAFSFTRKSVKIQANYSQNTFRLTTQNVASFCVLVSPKQINMQEPVLIYVNDQLVFNQVVGYDKEFMLENFSKNQDKDRLWVNKICIDLLQK